jgi:copper homeostasis protein
MGAIASVAGACPLVCHRAFDLTAGPEEALERLVDLGFSRILTNGRSSDALKGAPQLRRLSERARGRIGILPGGGVRGSNAAAILKETGLREIHLGPFRTATDVWSGDCSIRAMAEHATLNADEVRLVRDALDRS